MLDIKWIRNNKEEVQSFLQARNHDFPLDNLLMLDDRRRNLIAETETLKAERNEGSKKVAMARNSGEDTTALKERMKEIGARIKQIDGDIAAVESELESLLFTIPNRPHSTVPIGADEDDNIEVRK